MRYFYFFILISLIVIPDFLQAQSFTAQNFTFLPENSFRFSQDYQKIQRSRIFITKNKRTSILSYELDQQDLESDAVEGEIRYKTQKNKLSLQFGVSPSINLGVEIPQIKKSRNTTLTAKDSTDLTVSSFISSRQSIEQTGMGDKEFWLLWRTVYTDIHDFQMGLNYNDKSGYFSLDQKNGLSLGSGLREITPYLRWIYYIQSSKLAIKMETSTTITKEDNLRDSSGDEVEMTRGNGLQASLNLSGQFGFFSIGGEIRAESIRPLMINGVDQQDGYLGYFYGLNINVGNINLLEEGPLLLPWEVDLYIRNAFWGANIPGDENLGLVLSLYF